MSNKWILIVLSIIIVILIGVSAIKGISIKEGVRIASVKETLALGDEYEKVLNKLDSTEVKYNNAIKTQQNAIKAYEQSKQEFEYIKNIKSYEELVQLAATREFNIEALWIKLGLIAESNELTHVFNVSKSGSTQTYDINVQLTGSYSGIRNFIDDIMMDMDLMFKAENIVIEGAGSALQDGKASLKGTFTIKNVNIVM